jgi:hypothetical protein
MVLELNQGPVGGHNLPAGSISTPKVETAKPVKVDELLPLEESLDPQETEFRISDHALMVTEEPDVDDNGQEVVVKFPEQTLQAITQR